MLEYLDGYDLASYLRMLRSADTRAFLVVEGPSDYRILNSLINESDCAMIPGYGKKSVLDAMSAVSVVDDDVIGLVDRDFDPYLAIPDTAGTVTTYEGHDSTCAPHTYTVGMGFVDPGGGHVHVIRNDGAVEARTITVQVIPAGAVRRVDAPDPGHCGF